MMGPEDIAMCFRPIRTELQQLRADLAAFRQRFAATEIEIRSLRAMIEVRSGDLVPAHSVPTAA